MKPRPAVYNKSCLGQNIFVHLVKRVPKLGHPYTIQIKHQGIEVSGVLTAPLPAKVRDWRHNSKIRVVDLRQLRQFIGNGIAFGLSFLLDLQGNPGSPRHRHRDPVAFLVLKMAFPFKAAYREDLPIKLKWRNRLQELLQMLIFFPVQVLKPLHDGLLICSHTSYLQKKK